MFKQPLKEYFSFSASERNAILIIVVLIIIVLAVKLFATRKLTDRDMWDFTVLSFEESETFENPARHKNQSNKSEIAYFYFNPNTLSDSLWMKLGLKKHQIQNIRNYIAKVGMFETKEDFKSLYTLSDAQYSALEPYLMLEKTNETLISDEQVTDRLSVYEIENDTLIVETMRKHINLNTCEATDLEALKGIGPVFSKRIKKYQDLLGGFASIEQLSEVYGITDSLILGIKPYLLIDTSVIKKININTTNSETLIRHPYITPYEANAIILFRDYKNVVSPDQLVEEKIISLETYNKIRPYLE